jgi:hypothetical protein
MPLYQLHTLHGVECWDDYGRKTELGEKTAAAYFTIAFIIHVEGQGKTKILP